MPNPNHSQPPIPNPNPDPDPDPKSNPDPGVLQTTNVAATAVGPLVIGVAHDAGASYAAILRSIAATTALVLQLRKAAKALGEKGSRSSTSPMSSTVSELGGGVKLIGK